MNLTLEVFAHLKDIDSNGLKMLIHNAGRLFPEKFEYASAELIRERLEAIRREMEERSKISDATLRFKAKYPDAPLDAVTHLVKSLFQTVGHQGVRTLIRERLLPQEFEEANIEGLNKSLGTYQEGRVKTRQKVTRNIAAKLQNLYGQNIEPRYADHIA